MQCIRCKKEVEPMMDKEKLCQNCFVDLIENRARKSISNKKLGKQDKLLLVEDGTKEFAVTNYLLRKILANVPLTIEVKKKSMIDIEKEHTKYTAIVLPHDMDDEAETLMTAMLKNKQLSEENTIKLLQNVYDREVKLFADIKKFTYIEQEQSRIQKALNKIEQKYPHSEFALLNSIKALRESQK